MRSLAMAAATLLLLLSIGCSTNEHLPPGMIGRVGKYDYSPSVIQTGTVRQFWYCGFGRNPEKHSQETDTIVYESVDMSTGATQGPQVVMGETPGAWDSMFVCNPKVIEGVFNNPLGDGRSFKYAMYYVGTSDGDTNNIGVAFSNDGIAWTKYPDPVIRTAFPTGYGVGQPAVYNSDHKAGIRVFYEDSNPAIHHLAAVSKDGVNFTIEGTLTDAGLDTDSPQPTWGDMAYDAKTDMWYAIFNRGLRDPATTGGVGERGQLGVELYRIPNSALMGGSTGWQQLTIIDTLQTGFESNFLGGFVRDMYGTLNVAAYPSIVMYLSVSDPAPAWDASPKENGSSGLTGNWDLAPFTWAPDSPPRTLSRYFNGEVHNVTTGWVSPAAQFQSDATLGHLYESPHGAATVPLYGCKSGKKGFFVSLDSACEGEQVLGTNGYGYASPAAGQNVVGLYRCSNGEDRFASHDPQCEGQKTEQFLLYVDP